MRLRRRRLPLAQERRGTAVGSLLLGLYDDAGNLQHVGVCASFTDEKRRELVEFLAPYRKNALADHPWSDGPSTSRTGAGQRMPGGAEPLEPGQGSVVGAAASGARRRGRVRSHAGQPLPSHGAVPPLAHGQEARRLHVRAARGGSAAGAVPNLRCSLVKSRDLAISANLAVACALVSVPRRDFHRRRFFFFEEILREKSDAISR